MDMQMTFTPNIDLTKAFRTKMMLVNNIENAENGLILIQPGADGPPIHTHPEQEETFRVIRGEVEIYLKDRWNKIGPGEEIFVAKKTTHTFRSRSQAECLFEYILTPKRNFTGMIDTLSMLMDKDKIKDTSSLKSKIYLSMTFDHYSSEILSVNPPPFVIKTMAGIGKLLGYSIE